MPLTPSWFLLDPPGCWWRQACPWGAPASASGCHKSHAGVLVPAFRLVLYLQGAQCLVWECLYPRVPGQTYDTHMSTSVNVDLILASQGPLFTLVPSLCRRREEQSSQGGQKMHSWILGREPFLEVFLGIWEIERGWREARRTPHLV